MNSSTVSRRSTLLVLASTAPVGPWVSSALAHDGHQHGQRPGSSPQAEAGSPAGIVRTSAQITVPEATLQRETGQTTRLADSLSTPDPVLLNFIYTSCSTVCPVQAHVFAQVQTQAQRAGRRVRLVSVSIDPLHDTPQRLAAYARQFEAGSQWHFLTGTREASIAVQRAFDTWRGDKMNHPVVTFIRPAGRRPWVRLEGHATAGDLLRELSPSAEPTT